MRYCSFLMESQTPNDLCNILFHGEKIRIRIPHNFLPSVPSFASLYCFPTSFPRQLLSKTLFPWLWLSLSCSQYLSLSLSPVVLCLFIISRKICRLSLALSVSSTSFLFTLSSVDSQVIVFFMLPLRVVWYSEFILSPFPT